MEILLLGMVLGVIPGAIASNKGHSFFVWWLFGAALFIVALPLAIILKSDEQRAMAHGDRRKCPRCAELIRSEANVCRFCGRDVVPAAVGVPAGHARCPGCGVFVPLEAKASHRC